MHNFIYERKTKLVFGKDMLHRLPKEIKKHGSRVLLTYGMNSIKKTGLYDQVIELLKENEIYFVELGGIKPNPEVDTVRAGVQLIQEHNLDFVLAVGGGSVIDNSKHMILMNAAKQDIWDIVKDRSLAKDATDFLPLGTILTISATGSEMNHGGVVTNPDTMEKLSTGHPALAPAFSFLDPTQLETLPKKQRVAGLADTFSHLLEVYFTSHEDEGFGDRLIESLMNNLLNYADDYLADNTNYESNAQFMLTATYALNGTTALGKLDGDWSAHDIEHDLSALTDITHGIGLALIQPTVLEVFLNNDLKKGYNLAKFVNLGKYVFGLNDTQLDDEIIAQKTVKRIKEIFFTWIDNAKLKDYDIIDFDYDSLINRMIDSSVMSNLYHTWTKEDLLYVYTTIS